MLVASSCSERRFICRRQRGAPSQLTAGAAVCGRVDGLGQQVKIITTSKLVVCTAPLRGAYWHSPLFRFTTLHSKGGQKHHLSDFLKNLHTFIDKAA